MPLSANDIAAAAKAAGFTGNDIRIAVAVALAESGGRPDASHRNSNGSTDYGLWQINSIHSQILKSGNWADPAANARMAHQVWQNAGGKWTPWVTYKTGAYLRFMGTNINADLGTITPASGSAESTTPTGSDSGGLGGISDLAHALSTSQTWWRVGYVVCGSVLVLLGVRAMIRRHDLVNRAVKVVGR